MERYKQLYLGDDPGPPVVYEHQVAYLAVAYGLESEVIKQYLKLSQIKVPKSFSL